jgi:hypothetical protein
MLDAGVDGLMPAKPAALERFLCARGMPRPSGNPNHCGAGARAAAAACRASVRSIGRMARDGAVTLRLRRAAPVNFACAGRVRLRAIRRARTIATARFAFPYGIDEAIIATRLDRATRRRVRAARRGLAVSGSTRVDGQAHGRALRVRVRRASS